MRLRGPASWPENHPAAARTKAISWAPPPCSSIRKGGPLYGWKNRGIFAVMVTGRRGLRVCRHVGQLLAHRPRVSKPHGGRGPLISGCRCRAGVKGWRGHSPGERGHLGPERAPRENPKPGPPWLQRLPQAPALWPGPAHLGPSSLQVNAFCGHQGPEAADAFTGRGVRALGDRGLSGHSPFSSSLGQILESEVAGSKFATSGQGGAV